MTYWPCAHRIVVEATEAEPILVDDETGRVLIEKPLGWRTCLTCGYGYSRRSAVLEPLRRTILARHRPPGLSHYTED